MKQGLLLAVWLAVVALCVGCSTTETRRYDVTVRNETGRTITLWLTKDGPPEQAVWRSPEQVAMSRSVYDERLGGITLPAGKTAFTQEVKGDFRPESLAWLRVYEGQFKSLSDLLAVSPRSPLRTDFALSPGRSYLVVREGGAKLTVESEGQEMKVPGAK
jgi:hypothetical protein